MTTPNVHQRLHAVMKAVDYIQKERKQGMRYTIVSHDAVTAKVRPVLVEHGVIYYPVEMQATQEGNRTQVQLKVRFANIDQPADFIDVCGLGYGVDDQDKGPGKAISYAVKYCLLKALGLETGDDPDLEDQPAKPPAIPPGTGKPLTVAPPAPPNPNVATPWNSSRAPADQHVDDWNIVVNDIIAEIARTKYPHELAGLYPDHERRMAKAPEEMKKRVLAVGKQHHAELMKQIPAMAGG